MKKTARVITHVQLFASIIEKWNNLRCMRSVVIYHDPRGGAAFGASPMAQGKGIGIARSSRADGEGAFSQAAAEDAPAEEAAATEHLLKSNRKPLRRAAARRGEKNEQSDAAAAVAAGLSSVGARAAPSRAQTRRPSIIATKLLSRYISNVVKTYRAALPQSRQK